MKINATTRVLSFLTLTSLLFLALVHGHAQQFVKLAEGDLVNSPSDSRSINCVDINADGYDDVFITNGPSAGSPNYLYLNNGDGTFTTVTDDPIVLDTSAFDGATFADADNDGDLDAYVVTWYGLKNYFYRNDGGSFTYEPESVSGSLGTYSETASWGDPDGDGFADLYVTNSGGNKKNLFYVNDGAGNPEPVEGVHPAVDTYYSRGVNWVDYDNDGDPDLFVCNESNQLNNLYRNDGDGVFTKIESVAPVSGSFSSMSSSWADVDNDGDLDLFIANSQYFSAQNNQLYFNNGDGTFSEVSDVPIVNDGGCSYSSSFADYDNDGDLDLFVSNGYCGGEIVNFLYSNDGSGNFERDTLALPDFLTPCSFGAAWADLDKNGFLDLVVSTCKNSSSSPLPENLVFMNQGNSNHWLKINLEGSISNRSALGARIYVTALINGSEVTQMREVTAQDGYCSQSSLTVHFGLADASGEAEVVVVWPSGNTYSKNVNPDSVYFILESPFTGKAENAGKPELKMVPYTDPVIGLAGFNILNPLGQHMDQLLIYDLMGRQRGVYGIHSSQHELRLPMKFNLEPGIYIAGLKSGGSITRVKFLMN